MDQCEARDLATGDRCQAPGAEYEGANVIATLCSGHIVIAERDGSVPMWVDPRRVPAKGES